MMRVSTKLQWPKSKQSFQKPIFQILREINFGDSRSAKYAILTNLEALNFDFYEILHFLKAEIDQIHKFQSPKMAVIELLDSPKLISRKIWMTKKSSNFHIVVLPPNSRISSSFSPKFFLIF